MDIDKQECAKCKFSDIDQPQYTYGNCRRYPPVAGYTFSVKPGKWGEGGEATITRFPGRPEYPNVKLDSWCGEFLPA